MSPVIASHAVSGTAAVVVAGVVVVAVVVVMSVVLSAPRGVAVPIAVEGLHRDGARQGLEADNMLQRSSRRYEAALLRYRPIVHGVAYREVDRSRNRLAVGVFEREGARILGAPGALPAVGRVLWFAAIGEKGNDGVREVGRRAMVGRHAREQACEHRVSSGSGVSPPGVRGPIRSRGSVACAA